MSVDGATLSFPDTTGSPHRDGQGQSVIMDASAFGCRPTVPRGRRARRRIGETRGATADFVPARRIGGRRVCCGNRPA